MFLVVELEYKYKVHFLLGNGYLYKKVKKWEKNIT